MAAVSPEGRRLRDEAVAAATGHPVHMVVSRGAAWCRANPVQPRDDFDFDQSAPVEFEDRSFVDTNLDAEIVQTGTDANGIPFRLSDANSQTARITDGRALAVSVRRVSAQGGLALVAKIRTGDVDDEIMRTPPLSAEEVEIREAPFRDAAHAYAKTAEPLYARRGRATVMLDPRIGGAANDAPAAAIAQRLAR